MVWDSDNRNIWKRENGQRELPPGREWLLARLDGDEPLVVPGAFDAVSARLVEQFGFEAAYCGGYAAIASAFGRPDLGLAGFTDMLGIYRRVRNATSVPLLVDADTGYGSALNVANTVSEFAALGVTAIQIEDQVNPKQCGHLDQKEVVPIEEGALRIKVAAEIAGTDGPAIIGRVDALAPEGMDAAVERANRYAEEGASIVLVDAVRTRAELEEIRERVGGHLMFNAASTGIGPSLTATELGELGYSLIVYPIELLYAAFGAMRTMLAQLRLGQGVPERGEWHLPSFDEVNEFLGLPAMVAWEQAAAEALAVSRSAPPQ